MSARFLAWYICAALGLATLLFTAVTVAPGHEWVLLLFLIVTGTGAVGFAIVGHKLGQLPLEHWRQVRTVRQC